MNKLNLIINKGLVAASCSLLLVAGSSAALAQVQPDSQQAFEVAQATGTTPDGNLGNPGYVNPNDTNSTPTNSTTDSMDTPAAGVQDSPPQSTTNVEIHNPPAANVPRSNPDINVQMPDMNFPESTDRETIRTERSERLIMQEPVDTDDADNPINVMYLALFGILVIFLIGVIAIAATRREDTSTYQ